MSFDIFKYLNFNWFYPSTKDLNRLISKDGLKQDRDKIKSDFEKILRK